MGTFRPFMVNPVPVRVACEILRGEPPVFVRVSDRVCELPTGTLPKLMLVGLAVRDPDVTPLPDNTILSDGLDAVLVIAMLPFTFPLVVGAKVTVNVVLCPAGSVSGKLSAVRPKPVPMAEACEIVTLELLPLLRVIVLAWLFPTCTFPKLTLAGFAASEDTIKPLPARGIFSAPAVLARETLPLTFPPDWGANVILRTLLCPGDNVSGKLRLLIPNPAPVVVAWDTVRLVPPEFVMVAVWF